MSLATLFHLVHTPQYLPNKSAPAITAKIAIVMISVSECHLVLFTLGSFISVKYS